MAIGLTKLFLNHMIFSMTLINSAAANEWVVVVTVSEWYHDIFQNWLFWYKSLDLEMVTILIAEDTRTYEKYVNATELIVLQYEMEKVSMFLYW